MKTAIRKHLEKDSIIKVLLDMHEAFTDTIGVPRFKEPPPIPQTMDDLIRDRHMDYLTEQFNVFVNKIVDYNRNNHNQQTDTFPFGE